MSEVSKQAMMAAVETANGSERPPERRARFPSQPAFYYQNTPRAANRLDVSPRTLIDYRSRGGGSSANDLTFFSRALGRSKLCPSFNTSLAMAGGVSFAARGMFAFMNSASSRSRCTRFSWFLLVPSFRPPDSRALTAIPFSAAFSCCFQNRSR